MAMVQICVTVRHIIQRQEALMHIQESLQMTLFVMGHAIRGAGNMGCIKWQDAQTRIVSNGISLLYLGLANDKAIHITNREKLKSNPLISKSLINRIKPDTDVLWIVSSIPAPYDYKPGDIIVRSDCTQVELLKPGMSCQGGCRKLVSTLYYVSKTNNLYFEELNRKAAAQLEGVEDLKISLIPGGVRMKFIFAHLGTRLEWEREWLI